MATLSASPAPPRGWQLGISRAEGVALACLGAALLLQLELVFSKSVNWDEFYHFSEIQQYRLGRWSPSLQTPYVYLFSWVPSLPGDNIAHIQLTRAMLLPFELVTLVAIFAMARHFTSREAALLCSLAYLTGGYVFLHAFAIRADIIAAALLSVALWSLLTRPLRALELALACLLVTLAFIATIKSVLWAPAFLGVLLYRLDGPQLRSRGVRALAIAAAAGLLGLALLQAMGLLAYVLASAEWMFSAGVFPQGQYLLQQVTMAPALAVLIATAVVFSLTAARGATRLALLSLLAPLLTLAVYRNSFPYHFVFILPPALVAVAPVADQLLRRYGLAPLAAILLANAALLSLSEDRSVLPRQEAIQLATRQVFPEPVVYVDESGMIGNFPRAVGRFASGWALADYKRKGRPIYSRSLEREPVPLLIANSDSLQNLFFATGSGDRLLAEDVRTLRTNYVPHWGTLFVAGKSLAAGTREQPIDVAVPGTYTVEGAPVEIDGRQYRPGDLVSLDRGPHRVTVLGGEGAVLRWGDHLRRPDVPWPEGPIFTDY